MINNATVPSIPYIAYSLFKFLANHPLIVHPVVTDPITKEPVSIAVFQFMHGFPTEEGLICSIYPSYQNTQDTPAPPTSTAISTLFKTHDLGQNYDEAIYHFIIEFSMREVSFPGANVSTDSDLTTVPTDALVEPNQRFFIKQDTREVPLYLNPPMDIIGDYLEITRLALNDVTHKEDFPINVKSIEVIHSNYSSSGWDTGTGAITHKGYLSLRITAFTSRGWRDKFILPLERINLDYSHSVSRIQLDGAEPESITGRVIEGESSNCIAISEKGTPYGVATLDSTGKVPSYQLPASSSDAVAQIENHNHDSNAHSLLLSGKQDHTETLDSLNEAVPAAGLVISNGVQYSTTTSLDGGLF